MRGVICLGIAMACASPSVARDPIIGPPAHYYGPLNTWLGVGYKEKTQKDGPWRIVANSRYLDGQNFSRDMVLYRAAELARAAGHTHVQILGASLMRGMGNVNYGSETAIIFARGADTDAAPTQCADRKPTPETCFTVSVAKIMEAIEPRLVRRSAK